jgi:insertion element IS1 protein InsB
MLERLKRWKVSLYCTDAYAPYDCALPVGKHFQGKEQTWRLEQNNGRQRYWYRRFQRRTIVVSKTRRMVDRTVALFARFHVNGTLEEIAQLFGFPTIAAILAEVP